jgi:hypothetical protein
MIAFKPLLLLALLLGTSSAFAVLQPGFLTTNLHGGDRVSTILKMNGGGRAAPLDPPPPELKVR